jgi:hypothetical protein
MLPAILSDVESSGSVPDTFRSNATAREHLAALKEEKRKADDHLLKLDKSLNDAELLQLQAHRRAERSQAKAERLRQHSDAIDGKIQQYSRKLRDVDERDEKAEAASPPEISMKSGALMRASASVGTDTAMGFFPSVSDHKSLRPSDKHKPMSQSLPEEAFRRNMGRQRTMREDQSITDIGDAALRREQEKHHREAIRQKLLEKAAERHPELVERVGPALAVFRVLDLSRSGRISLNEFVDGVTRLGINWQSIVGSKSGSHLFSLFDRERRGIIDFASLFPGRKSTADTARLGTPEFWEYYTHKTKESEMKRGPRYEPGSVDEKLQVEFLKDESNTEAARRKTWMAATMRRLKNRGKSDARCREIVALHLPKGTGPGDMEKVPLFSENDVKVCKKKYQEKWNEPVHNIQKIVLDMKEQRKVLSIARQKLFATAIEPAARSSLAEDLVGGGGLSGFGGFGGGGLSLSKPKESVEEADTGAGLRMESKPRRSSFLSGE